MRPITPHLFDTAEERETRERELLAALEGALVFEQRIKVEPKGVTYETKWLSADRYETHTVRFYVADPFYTIHETWDATGKSTGPVRRFHEPEPELVGFGCEPSPLSPSYLRHAPLPLDL